MHKWIPFLFPYSGFTFYYHHKGSRFIFYYFERDAFFVFLINLLYYIV